MLMRIRSTRATRTARALGVGVLVLATAGALAACGDDSSTAESDTSASSGPSQVVPANPTTSGEVVTTTPNPHSDGGDSGSGDAQDGGISEITELPEASAVRGEEDNAFLDELKGKNIEVDDQVLQDQMIAAAHEQCLANEEGRDSFAVPAIAGQLQALGESDEDPEVIAEAIKAAAEANYCG